MTRPKEDQHNEEQSSTRAAKLQPPRRKQEEDSRKTDRQEEGFHEQWRTSSRPMPFPLVCQPNHRAAQQRSRHQQIDREAKPVQEEQPQPGPSHPSAYRAQLKVPAFIEQPGKSGERQDREGAKNDSHS